MTPWKGRLRAASIHLCISLCVATLAAWLVFELWFPYPYREISGGRNLFLLVVMVDVILGPLITFTVFNRAKPIKELRRDLAIVGLVQLAGLGYGLWTVALARPVHLVFEIDRFRVVHAVDIPPEELSKTPAGIKALPLTGPTLLAVRPFKDDREKLETTLAALQGVALGSRPDLWESYEAAKSSVLAAVKPVTALQTRMPTKSAEIDAVLKTAGRNASTTSYLPMTGRQAFWTAFVDPVTAEVAAFMPLDSF
ncbi:MAG: pilus assembly protein [Ramlibacter sp.]|nr:pilus assembly protein [Ramlibacter sp.]